jgi:hypothetical protein
MKSQGSNEKLAMKYPDVQWKARGAMKSGQWNILACNEKCPMKSQGSNEKLAMKYPGLQWKVPNEKPGRQWKASNEISWPAMKYPDLQWKGPNEKPGEQWKASNEISWPAMKNTQWKARGAMKSGQWNILACNEKCQMKSPGLQWQAIENTQAFYEKFPVIKRPGHIWYTFHKSMWSYAQGPPGLGHGFMIWMVGTTHYANTPPQVVQR